VKNDDSSLQMVANGRRKIRITRTKVSESKADAYARGVEDGISIGKQKSWEEGFKEGVAHGGMQERWAQLADRRGIPLPPMVQGGFLSRQNTALNHQIIQVAYRVGFTIEREPITCSSRLAVSVHRIDARGNKEYRAQMRFTDEAFISGNLDYLIHVLERLTCEVSIACDATSFIMALCEWLGTLASRDHTFMGLHAADVRLIQDELLQRFQPS
jgi:hypothetical protein